MNFINPQESDFNRILELNNVAKDEYKNRSVSAGNILWSLTYNDLKEHLDTSHSVIARDGENIAGYALTFPLEAQTRNKKFIIPHFLEIFPRKILNEIAVCIGQVFTSPDHRKKGIATQMYEKIIAWNTRYDLKIFHVDPQYRPAVLLHKKLDVIQSTSAFKNLNTKMLLLVLKENEKLNQFIKTEIKRKRS